MYLWPWKSYNITVTENKDKKHPCEDCNFCQFCSDSRCSMCRPSECKKKAKKIKIRENEQAPLKGLVDTKRH